MPASTLLPFSEAIFDTLLIVVFAVVLVSSAAWLIARKLSGNAALRHLILCSGLISIMAAPVLAWSCKTLNVNLLSIPLGDAATFAIAPNAQTSETSSRHGFRESSTDNPLVLADERMFETIETLTLDAENGAPTSQAATEIARQAAVPRTPAIPTAENSPRDATNASLPSYRRVLSWAMLAWAIGSVLMLLRLIVDCIRIVRLRRSSHLLQSEPHASMLREIASLLGMRQVPLLLISRRAIAPMAVGFGRPAVLLPNNLLSDANGDQLRDVLIHEVAHLKRKDHWCVLLQALAAVLYWPILSVHALNRELRRAREELCDNQVLAERDAISYGETLLHVAALLVELPRTNVALSMIGSQGELEQRISGLIDVRRNLMTTVSRRTSCLMIIAFLSVSLLASSARLSASKPADSPSLNQASATPKQAVPPASLPYKSQADIDPTVSEIAGYFSGEVKAPDGQPLSGVSIYLMSFYAKPKKLGAVRALTDADGRFAFEAPDMTYRSFDGLSKRYEALIYAMKEGYGPDSFHTWGANHRGIREWFSPRKGRPINLQLAKDDVPIQGQFLDPEGKPLAGALVQTTSIGLPFKFDLDVHLKREAEANVMRGFLTMPKIYERSTNNLDLLPGLSTETRTDDDGRFTLFGVGRERLATLRVSAPSAMDTSLTVMSREAADVETVLDRKGNPTQLIRGNGFTMKLTPGLTVKGVVRDRDTKAPIAGMWVAKYYNPLDNPNSSVGTTVTDENGRFVISGLNPKLLTWEQPRHREITAVPRPGTPYFMATTSFSKGSETVIECVRGIPFRLKVVDGGGQAVNSAVEYQPIRPNAFVDDLVKNLGSRSWSLKNKAAKRDGGIYEGFVMPGPGAILVKAYDRTYRPGFVDPKSHFEPGRTDWPEDADKLYGNKDQLTAVRGVIDQRSYDAIVLVNPQPSTGPLELTATLLRSPERMVSLIAPDGQPIKGVDSRITRGNCSTREQVNSASFPLIRLHPQRARRITFLHQDRQLIGYLRARGDGEAPYTVQLQRWGRVTGRFVDENGNPRSFSSKNQGTVQNKDVDGCDFGKFQLHENGRFEITQLLPGQTYTCNRFYSRPSRFSFTGLDELTLKPGESRDVGDIRVTPLSKK